jgi:threonine dehydrogenase-like Zn-dependent dehydrogenase
MIQALMTKPGEIIYQEVDVPVVGPEQIKVKMKRIGVCGSDIHVYHGKHPFTTYPVVQGHEVSAEVVEVGDSVNDFKPGDKVTIQPQVVCGKCYPCTHGMYNDCEVLKVMGFQTTGMASEYFVTEAAKALKLPDNISWDHGSMIEPLAVAIAINNAGNLKNNETTGQTIAPIIEPSETYLVKTTITIKTVRHISAGTGLIYRITANDVKTPLPPLKPKKTGQLWPITAANPAR